MKFSLQINQKTIVDSGLVIDLPDACIIDFLCCFSHSNFIKKMFLDGKTYYWFDYNKVASELPILKLKKDSVYRRLKHLSDIGLLEAHPENQTIGRPFYCFTEKMQSLFFEVGFKSEASDENPNPYGLKPEPPTDENPNYYSIKEDKDNNSLTNVKQNRKSFIVPEIEEVKTFFLGLGNADMADIFYDFYAKKGWMVGKSRMVDWKAAARGSLKWDVADKIKNKPQSKVEAAIKSGGGFEDRYNQLFNGNS